MMQQLLLLAAMKQQPNYSGISSDHYKVHKKKCPESGALFLFYLQIHQLQPVSLLP